MSDYQPPSGTLYICYGIRASGEKSYSIAWAFNSEEINLDGDREIADSHPWYPLIRWMAANKPPFPAILLDTDMQTLSAVFPEMKEPSWNELISTLKESRLPTSGKP